MPADLQMMQSMSMVADWRELPTVVGVINKIEELSKSEDPLGLSPMELLVFKTLLEAKEPGGEVALIEQTRWGWRNKGSAYQAIHALRSKLNDFAASAHGIGEPWRLSVE